MITSNTSNIACELFYHGQNVSKVMQADDVAVHVKLLPEYDFGKVYCASVKKCANMSFEVFAFEQIDALAVLAEALFCGLAGHLNGGSALYLSEAKEQLLNNSWGGDCCERIVYLNHNIIVLYDSMEEVYYASHISVDRRMNELVAKDAESAVAFYANYLFQIYVAQYRPQKQNRNISNSKEHI